MPTRPQFPGTVGLPSIVLNVRALHTPLSLGAYAELLAARGEGYAPQHLAQNGGLQCSKTLSAWRRRAPVVLI